MAIEGKHKTFRLAHGSTERTFKDVVVRRFDDEGRIDARIARLKAEVARVEREKAERDAEARYELTGIETTAGDKGPDMVSVVTVGFFADHVRD